MGKGAATETDAELVRRCKAGQREAFHELVERYHRKVASVAMGMLQDPEEALDVTQEAFTRAFVGLSRFRGKSSFYTWLYRIVVNLAIDRQRRRTRQPMLELGQEPVGAEVPADEGLGTPATSDPFMQASDSELNRHINAAINELPPIHRAVIILREVEGLSYEEISEVLKCSIGTVMSRLHYARKKLQARLRPFL